jgi:hypothetical protein
VLIRPDQLADRIASEQAGDYITAMQEYGLLKRNFESLHRYEEEDWAFYRFKVNQRRSHNRSWLRPWSKLGQAASWLLVDHGCGYGTDPRRAVRAAVLIVLAFALIYAAGITRLDVAVPPLADQPISSLANRTLFGMITSVAVFTSGLSADTLSRAHGWLFAPLLGEAVLGTLLWGLFIVAFSRKVIR